MKVVSLDKVILLINAYVYIHRALIFKTEQSVFVREYMYMCECVHIARNPKRDYMNLGKNFEKDFGCRSRGMYMFQESKCR